jgi:predicted permease
MYLIVCVLNILSEFITSFLFPSFLFSLITSLSSNDSLLSMLVQLFFFILLFFFFGVEVSGRCLGDLDHLLKTCTF